MTSGFPRPGSAPGYFPGSQVSDQRRSLDRSSLRADSKNLGAWSSSNNENQGIQLQGPGYELPQAHYYMPPIYQNGYMLQANINQAIYQNTALRSNRNIQRSVYHSAMFNANFGIQHAVSRNMSRSVGHLSRNRAPLSIEEANRLGSKASSGLSEHDQIAKPPKDRTQEEGSSRCVDMNGEGLDQQLPSNAESSTSLQDGDGVCSAFKCFLYVVKYILILAVGLLVGAAINSLVKCRSQERKYS